MTVERTIERPRVERTPPRHATRRSVITPIAVIAALVIGIVAGYVLGGRGDSDSDAAVVAGGLDLTARQEQMVDLIDDYVEAWQDGDGDAVAAMLTPQGSMTMLGTEFPVADGELAAYVDRSPAPQLDVLEPMLVTGDRLLNFHTVGGETMWSNVFRFTAEGELLIISHEIRG